MDAGKDSNKNKAQTNPLDTILQEFVKHLGGLKSIFVIWGPLNENFFEEILDFAKKNKYGDEKGIIKRLNIVLHSPGGDPHITYNASNVLRKCFDERIIYIPRFAKSAATLMCLGANEIILNLGSELGPLDTQIRDPNNPREYVSALEITEELRTAAEFLYAEIPVFFHWLREQGLPLTGNEFFSLVTHLLQVMGHPLFQQAELRNFCASLRALDISRRYGTQLLMRCGVEEEIARDIVNLLVKEYPSHSFVIDFDEVAGINLPIEVRETMADECKGLDALYYYISGVLKRIIRRDYYYGPLWTSGTKS